MALLAGAGTDSVGTDSLITDSVGTEPIGNGRVLTKDTENIDELIKTTKQSCLTNRLINCIPKSPPALC
jgi:hypothetical protein